MISRRNDPNFKNTMLLRLILEDGSSHHWQGLKRNLPREQLESFARSSQQFFTSKIIGFEYYPFTEYYRKGGAICEKYFVSLC